MIVFGTRPEAIKMCPLVNELKERDKFKTVVCVTGQHKEMLNQVLKAFSVIPEYNFILDNFSASFAPFPIPPQIKMSTASEESNFASAP